MSDTTERDAVRGEFYERYHHGHRTLTAARAAVRDAMAEEIVQQRRRADRAERILAALRDASMAVLADARKQFGYDQYAVGCQCMDALRAAVAQAEQEVGHA